MMQTKGSSPRFNQPWRETKSIVKSPAVDSRSASISTVQGDDTTRSISNDQTTISYSPRKKLRIGLDSNFERPRCSTPIRIGMGVQKMSDLTSFQLAGSGAKSNVYLDSTEQHRLAYKEAKDVDSYQDYLAEIKLNRTIDSALNTGQLDPILSDFKVSREQVRSALSLCEQSTQSKEFSPGTWYASAPAHYQTEELFDVLKSLFTSVIDPNAPLSPNEKRKIESSLTAIRDVMVIVSILHELDEAHLDIKPENILIDQNGQGYLIDFGFARLYSDNISKTGKAGSTHYIAPEIANHSEINIKSDIYSAGITLQTVFLGLSTQHIVEDPITNRLTWKSNPLYYRNIAIGWHKVTQQVFGEAITESLKSLCMPWVVNPKTNRPVENSGMTSLEPKQRPSAKEVALTLDRFCQNLGLNKPLSKERYEPQG